MFFKNKQILRFASVTGGTTIYFLDGSHIKIDESFESIELQLKDSDFIRIHDKHIVNVNHISKISNGTDDFIELSNSEVLPISRKQKQIIIELISTNLEK